MVLRASETGGRLEGDIAKRQWKLLGVMNMFMTLILVVVSCACTYINTYQIVYFKGVLFAVYPFCLSKVTSGGFHIALCQLSGNIYQIHDFSQE